MAGIEDLFKNGLGSGIAVAVGVAVIGPVVAPVIGRMMRPVVKNAIKGGIMLYGWGREGIAEMREYAEDTYAEAHAEIGDVENRSGSRGRGRAKTEGAASAS